MKKIISFFATSAKSRIEYKIIDEISRSINSGNCDAVIHVVRPFIVNLNVIFQIYRSHTIVLHSPLLHAFSLALIGRMMGKKIFVLAWDFYPVMLNGRRYDNRFLRRLGDFFETVAFKFCNKIFVPTGDFKKEELFRDASVLKFWPKINYIQTNKKLGIDKIRSIKIIFAGQVNETRGLCETINLLSEKSLLPFELLIASADVVPDKIASNPNVVILGELDNVDLQKHYIDCDFGLVSLSKYYDGPAFPSKTFEYIANGLPIIYCGPHLSAYVKLVQDSGIGIYLDEVEFISLHNLKQLNENFIEARDLFVKDASLNEQDREYFLSLLI